MAAQILRGNESAIVQRDVKIRTCVAGLDSRPGRLILRDTRLEKDNKENRAKMFYKIHNVFLGVRSKVTKKSSIFIFR